MIVLYDKSTVHCGCSSPDVMSLRLNSSQLAINKAATCSLCSIYLHACFSLPCLASKMSVITKEELMKNEFWQKKAAAVFKARDVSKDGFIGRDDYMIMIQRYKEMGVSKENLKKIEEYFDKLCISLGLNDESVKLTPEDVLDNFRKSDVTIEQYAKGFGLVFDAFDIDGNGVISFDEWEKHYKAAGLDIAHARASFDAMDTNHNGVVSKEEFCAYNVVNIITRLRTSCTALSCMDH